MNQHLQLHYYTGGSVTSIERMGGTLADVVRRVQEQNFKGTVEVWQGTERIARIFARDTEITVEAHASWDSELWNSESRSGQDPIAPLVSQGAIDEALAGTPLHIYRHSSGQWAISWQPPWSQWLDDRTLYPSDSAALKAALCALLEFKRLPQGEG